MAIDNAAFIADMNTEVPAITDPRSEGADQIAAVKSAVQATFPNADDVVNATAARMNEFFDNPYQRFLGEITMYDSSDNIPEGWALCDGGTYNGYVVPDLRGKFIMGYDVRETHAVLDTGGDNNPPIAAALEVDEHALTVDELPSHRHTYERLPNKTNSSGVGGSSSQDNNQQTGYTSYVGGNQGHDHGISDVEDIFDNRPEYVIVAFICYVGKEAAL